MQVGVLDDDEQVCQMEGCTEIDLLPAKCSNCGKTFCSRHISGAAHNCQVKRDAVVATCPVCQRVVPLEYPGQEVNEAVSRHMDRGCRDMDSPAASRAAPAAAPSLLTRAIHMLGVSPSTTRDPSDAGTGGGVRLGRATGGASGSSASSFCAVPGCTSVVGVRVRCDQCGKEFCINHRSPAQHQCTQQLVKPRVTTPTEPSTARVSSDSVARSTLSSSPSSWSASPSRLRSVASHRSDSSNTSATMTTMTALLAAPRNTRATASGKKTELPGDMVTSLICILLTRDTDDAATATTTRREPGASLTSAVVRVPPFYMHMHKNFALGRVVDLALDDAMTSEGASDLRPYRQQRWHVFIVPVPIAKDAKSEMYPEQNLSTVVGKTSLAAGGHSAVFISKDDALAPDALSALRRAQKKLL